ncbi:MAG: AAA family ATPase [Actinomycetota bacterium]|nr:AAA family ATPase [Actinomycetota bacterium]
MDESDESRKEREARSSERSKWGSAENGTERAAGPADSESARAAVNDVLEEMDREFVGLDSVKTRIREIAALLVIDRLREENGLSSQRPTLHMSFTGRPGTGKTTVALKMADILHRLGYVEDGHLVTVTRDELVGQYVGHTAPKTKDVVKAAYGGVLFIDEAYYLHRPDNERDYGQEAIEVLLAAMEQDRDKFVVVFAGYKEPMAEFFVANPGMGSRVAHHIDFPDYTVEELMQIAQMMLEQQGYEVSEAAEQAFREYVGRRVEQPRFANGRSIRNAIERARMRQASRLFDAEETPSREQLLTIEDNDIRKSSVFADEQDGGAGTRPNGDTPDDAASDGRADTQDQSEEETCHVPSS